MTRPLPEPDATSASFFEGLSRGTLMLQACRNCGQLQLGQERCFVCRSEGFDEKPAAGRGVVHSLAVMHAVFHPAFADETPYAVALVELEEGPRLLGRVRGLSADRVRIGQKVRVASDELAPGVFAPVFEAPED